MKIAFFDCFSGISGDMSVGALIDAGADLGELERAVASLGLEGVRIAAHRVNKAGILATQFKVLLHGEAADAPEAHSHGHTHTHEHSHDAHDHAHSHQHEHAHDHKHEHAHDHKHEHEHAHDHKHEHEHAHDHGHSHDHEHEHSHQHEHHHHHHHHDHRNLADIRKIVERADLPGPVKRAVLGTFQVLGEAEARVHGTTIDKIHFHEVGAVDSIVDIVCANLALHLLGIAKVVASPVHVGSGTVRCAHGVMPVPAPATALLLHGVPTYGELQGELTTPTGAALLAHHAQSYGGQPRMTVTATGFGAGSRDLKDRPNVLRVLIGELAETSGTSDSVLVIESMIDDMNPELVPPLIQALLEAGARDAYITPVLGKKGRPGQQVTVLCDFQAQDAVFRALMRNSTTLGARIREDRRIVLDRKLRRVSTPWGSVGVKLATFEGEQNTASPEFEDCAARAAAAGVPARMVYEAAAAEAVKGAFIDA